MHWQVTWFSLHLALIIICGGMLFVFQRKKGWSGNIPSFQEYRDSKLFLLVFLTFCLLAAGGSTLAICWFSNAFWFPYAASLVPLSVSGIAIAIQTLHFFHQTAHERWTVFWQKYLKTFVLLLMLLGLGAAVHGYLAFTPPHVHAYAPQDILDTEITEQDIYLVFLEGWKLHLGINPYARAANLQELRWNDRLPTYLPLIYYASSLTHWFGFTALANWLKIWRLMFIVFNLAIACVLFFQSIFHYRSTSLA
ncbi:MAG: hypothetical protein D6803_05920, partial [Anaerolineae bacterium]